NALVGPAHAPGTGAADIFMNQVTPPAVPVSAGTSVPVATFTTANQSLTGANFDANVFSFDSTGHGFVQWTVTSIPGSNGHFVLKENTATGNFELRDNGTLVFTQPVALTNAIHINADPSVPGQPGASVDDSLTIDYSGGTFSNAVTFDGGPGGGTHTLTFTG